MRNEIIEVLNIINNNGFEAYCVGGAIRDQILKIEPYDYDITTNALPKDIKQIFKDYKTIDIGIKHGTVKLLYKGMEIEITTYRIDGRYNDVRHPDSVIFTTSLEEDLKRRDFTMNAIAYNQQYVDYTNGIKDIENRIIRSVGNPDIRFSEDALRIIRAIRFSAQLNFTIEENTKKAIFKNYRLLEKIAIERIRDEIFKMLEFPCYNQLMEYKTVIEYILGIKYDITKKVDTFSKSIFKLAYIYRNVQNIESIEKLKLSNNNINIIKIIRQNKKITSKIDIKKLLREYGITLVENLVNYLKLGNVYNVQEIATEGYDLSMLKITGNDLIKLGYPKNESIKQVLNEMLDLVIGEKLDNEYYVLCEYAKNKRKMHEGVATFL